MDPSSTDEAWNLRQGPNGEKLHVVDLNQNIFDMDNRSLIEPVEEPAPKTNEVVLINTNENPDIST